MSVTDAIRDPLAGRAARAAHRGRDRHAPRGARRALPPGRRPAARKWLQLIKFNQCPDSTRGHLLVD